MSSSISILSGIYENGAVNENTSLQLMRQQYALGAVSYLQLLITQQQAQQTGINLIAARAQRLADTVALCQSMGGGWLHNDRDGSY